MATKPIKKKSIQSEEDALVKTLTQLARKGQFKLAEIIGLGSEVKFATETGEKYFSENEQHNAKGDAMRHLLLQAQLTQKHGEKTAKAISWAHENILDGQSSVEREMDTFNDELGREIGKKAKNKNEMTRMALEAIKKNKIKTLSEEQISETYDIGGVVKKKYPLGGNTNSKEYYGYEVRNKLFDGENLYFKNNPNVAGMAAEDGKIIFNPYSKLSQEKLDAVGYNEASRLYMRENNIVPNISINDEQRDFFKDTEYKNNEDALKQTIIARYISGDPSANLDKSQLVEAENIKKNIENMKKKYPYGGNTNSTIEAEGGEVLETPQGQVGNINGPSHASGGVTMNVPDGSLIFSDRIGIKNNKGKFLSLADRKKIREATLKKLNKKQRDPFQLNTLQRTGEKLAKEEEADVALQTMIRKQVEGDQNNDIPKAALGAGLTTGDKLTAGANVASSLFNVFSTLNSIGDTKPALRMNSNLNKDYGIAGLKNLDNVSDNLKIQNTYAENQIKNQLTQNKQDATAAIDNAGGSLNLRRALRSDLATKTNKIYSDSMTDLSSALAAKEGELGVTKSNMLNTRDAKVAEGEAKKLDFNSNAQRYDQAVERSNSQASSAAGQSVFGAVQSIGSALNTNQKNEQTLSLYNKILDQSTGGSGLTVPGLSESTGGYNLSVPGLSEDPDTYTSIFPSAYKFPYGGTTGKQPKGSIQPFIKKGPTPDKNDMSATFNRLLSMIQPNNDSFKLPTQKKKSVSISSNNDDNEIISTGITKSPDYNSIRKRTKTTASVKDNSEDVLDLIARGESSNNYDAVSNSKPLNGLSNMTLQDVMSHAKRTGKHVGAWQFGHNEIETTAKKLGLDLKKTKYSPAIQRQLAKQLALDHGLGDFLKGKTSSEKAIYRLSQKWAALPKDKSGKSYYEGKGTNKANINFDELYTILGSNG